MAKGLSFYLQIWVVGVQGIWAEIRRGVKPSESKGYFEVALLYCYWLV